MPISADLSVTEVIDTIRRRYPHAPFLALGQTAFWDEPVKATWRRLLDQHDYPATLIAGVHDTDYFAKTVAHLGDDQKYVALPHDDGDTRDLWSAAGELSALFGSESVPTRQMFRARNVPFDWLAQRYPGGKDQLYADKTAAWGWRGLVSTQGHNVIAHDILLRDIQAALLAQLDWAFTESLRSLESPTSQERARATIETIRGWIDDFIQNCDTGCRLTDLYQWLVPRFYTLLLNAPPANFKTTASTELFRFNSQTCQQPRFQILQVFLNPKTRQIAKDAYNRAVAGSGIYTLDGFGDGAVPFDVVIPGLGRGTLRLLATGIAVATAPTETTIESGRIATIGELAQHLEQSFGPDIALVGKAVTLVDMLSAEFLLLFHETASAYTTVTQQFNMQLARSGIALPLYPLVRLAYETWDSLAAVSADTVFRLPAHLAATFGQESITAPAFARDWRGIVEAQKKLVDASIPIRNVRSLMAFLEEHDPQHCWCDQSAEYEQANQVLRAIAEKSETLSTRIAEHRDELRLWRKERQGLEARMGEDWRKHVQPLREKIRSAAAADENTAHYEQELGKQIAIRATAFEEPLHICRERINATKHLISEFRRQKRLLERGENALQARETMRQISWEAQLARLDLVRNAFLTIDGLNHTNLRPTAWWLPLIDPSGAWFDAIADSARVRLEYLSEPATE